MTGSRRGGGRDFRIVWLGQGISSVGTAVTALALPLLALLDLHVHAWQVGLLTACTYAAYAVLALPAGVWLDRRARRPLVITGDAGRLVALASVPLAQALGILTFTQLVLVALTVGALTVVFDIAYQSWLPSLVDPASLVRANGRLGATDAAGRLAGPGVAGVLVASIGAAYALGLDAATFAVATLATLAVRARESSAALPEASAARRQLRSELAVGLSWLRTTAVLRALVAYSAAANFFVATWLAVESIFLVRTLHASPTLIGIVLAVGSSGGIVGGMIAGWLSRRLGSCRAVVLGAAVGGPFALLAPLGTAAFGAWSVAVGLLGVTLTSAVYSAGATSYRQQATPPALLARVTSAVRLASYVVLPVGALFGGILATSTDPRTAMIVAAVGYGAAAVWLAPLRVRRDFPPFWSAASAAGGAHGP